METIEEIKELYEDCLDDELLEELETIDNIDKIDELYDFLYYKNINDTAHKICVEKYYQTVDYFLTDQEAKNYIKYQGHNLTNPRTYIYGCGYSNRGYLPKLMDILSELKFE